MEEERNDDQLGSSEESPRASMHRRVTTTLAYHTMSLAEKAKYAACGGGISAGIFEILGGGGAGLGLAALVAFASGYWSEELQQGLVKKLPRPRESQSSRANKLSWWLTGDEDHGEQESATVEQTDVIDVPEEVVQPSEDSLFLSRTLRPHANAVFSNRVAILGIPGAGKSNTVAVFAEELGQFGAPLVIFDTENEYKPLCAKPYFKRPFAAGCLNVNLETAFSFGQQIMDERLQVVLNLDSYDNDDAAALIMIDVIKGIQAWEEALPNDDRIPCVVILDEAAVWLPQNPKDSMLSKKEDDNGLTTLDKLQQIFFSVVVRRGRKRGIGFILASQRSAEIDKRAIASAQWKILQEQNQPSDLKVYHEFGVDKDIAQSLGNGQAFVIGPKVRGVHQIRKRHSPDNAKTPGLESLRKKRFTESLVAKTPQVTRVIEPVITARLPETQPLPEKPPVVAYQPSKVSTPSNAKKYERALAAWNAGSKSSRKLAEALGISKDKAWRAIQEMKRLGLIQESEDSL